MGNSSLVGLMELFAQPKSTLVVANGAKPTPTLLNHFRRHATTLIAIDGALLWLKTQGVTPDLVIGDFDSVSIDECKNTVTCFVDDQNTNDLAKALTYCASQGLHDVIVLGAFGLRADHFLTNLYVLRNAAIGSTITLVDDQHLAFMCPRDRAVVFSHRQNSFISLFPFSDDVGPIWSTGVAYPLNGEKLSLCARLGTLNRIVKEQATIVCAHKDLLVMVENTLMSTEGFK